MTPVETYTTPDHRQILCIVRRGRGSIREVWVGRLCGSGEVAEVAADVILLNAACHV
jgi:hypothetical protein